MIPSQKNSKRIAVNSRTGKRFVMTDKRVKDWREEAKGYLPDKHFNGSVEIAFKFWHKDKRRHDLDNEMTSLFDLFVLNGLIDDDSCFVIKKVSAEFMGVDKNKYGVEVEIKSLEDDEDS